MIEFAKKYWDDKRNHEYKYYMHVFFPDMYEPQRVPSLYPSPSHISREHFTFSSSPDASGRLVIAMIANNIISQDFVASIKCDGTG
jgi:hypothetical protein